MQRQEISLRTDALPPDGNNRKKGRNMSKKSYSAIVRKEYPQEATYNMKEISYFLFLEGHEKREIKAELNIF